MSSISTDNIGASNGSQVVPAARGADLERDSGRAGHAALVRRLPRALPHRLPRAARPARAPRPPRPPARALRPADRAAPDPR